MHITPLEIRKQPFRKSMFGGLDKSHVESFLEQIASEFEEIRKENDSLSSKIKEMSTDLERYKRIENTLNETLLTAQRVTDEARTNAQKEAELIIKEAQLTAEKLEGSAKDNVLQLQSSQSSLVAQKDSFLARFRALLTDQLSFIEIMESRLEDNK
jgi:cell division initiation protein